MASTSAPTSVSIIGVLGFLAIIFMAIQLVLERYGLVDSRNVALSRMITFAFMINTGIIVFMVLSYNYVEGKPGPAGPKGIRGASGDSGSPAVANLCTSSSTTAINNGNQPEYRTLGTLRNRQNQRNF